MATQQKVQLLMPEMGESVTEGTVLEWHVSEGDSVEEGDTMVEVSTDKVDAEVPAPASGTVAKILVQVDEEIDVGKPLAEIDPNGGPPEADSNGDSAQDQADTTTEGEASAGAAAETASDQNGGGSEEASSGEKATSDDASVSAGKELEGGGLEIVMPEMGESVTEGEVLEWHVSEGDAVEEGQTIVEVSTDKVDAEVPAPASGTITKIVVGPDETVEVGKPLAEMTKGEPPKEVEATAGADARTASGGAGDGSEDASSDADGGRATPVARRAAQANGVDLAGVKGTGHAGKITKADVLNGERGDADGAAAPAAAE